MCYLIPNAVEIGSRITCANTLTRLSAAERDPAEQTRLAREIGAAHGMPEANGFFVPGDSCGRPVLDGNGLLVAFIAKRSAPNAAFSGSGAATDQTSGTPGPGSAETHS